MGVRRLIKYDKIPVPFVRDSNKKMTDQWSSPELYNLRYIDWLMLEKVDGTNIGVHWTGYEVEFQGRTERADIPKHLLQSLNETFRGDAAEEIFEQVFGDKEVILFGEGYGNKIQKNGDKYMADECGFILFDVYFPQTDIWLCLNDVWDVADKFGIPSVPVVHVGNLQLAISLIKKRPMSIINPEHEMEGFVCRPAVELRDRMGKRIACKIKVKDFCEGVPGRQY